MKAVILAAGCATRLRPYSADTPKTLLAVGGEPILKQMLRNLQAAGFREFVIGTGYLEHMVREAVARWYPNLNVEFVSNPDFRSTNNAYSLLLTREFVDHEPFLLIDGDVVFEQAIVTKLIAEGPDTIAVRSRGGIGLEEVKLRANAQGVVEEIGKHIAVAGSMGESVGIEWFSASSSTKLFQALAQRIHAQGLVNEYYEASFQQIIDEGATLRGVDIEAYFASEIDTIEDLRAANAYLLGPAYAHASDVAVAVAG